MNGFLLIYNPQTHEGQPNTQPRLYKVSEPFEGFGNAKENDSFAGFRAYKLDDNNQPTDEVRSFKWERVVSMTPICQ